MTSAWRGYLLAGTKQEMFLAFHACHRHPDEEILSSCANAKYLDLCPSCLVLNMAAMVTDVIVGFHGDIFLL